eukprot:4883308-Amphidinium_carterae.1
MTALTTLQSNLLVGAVSSVSLADKSTIAETKVTTLLSTLTAPGASYTRRACETADLEARIKLATMVSQ